MMKLRIGSMLAVLALMAGCASKPQAPMALSAEMAPGKSGRIGVAMTPSPKVSTSFPGASCLLCIAAASVANSSLTSYVETLPPEDLGALKTRIAEALQKKGVDAIVIPDDIKPDSFPTASAKGPSLAEKDFSSLKAKYRIDKLVLIDVTTLGVERSYSAYIPTGDPKAVLRGTGFLVNLSTQSYEWYLPVNVLKSADGKWDEGPRFPGLTNAYYQALEIGKDNFVDPFVR